MVKLSFVLVNGIWRVGSMAESVARGVGLGSPMSEHDWWRDRATDAGVVAGRAVLAHQGGVGWVATLETPGRASTRRGG